MFPFNLLGFPWNWLSALAAIAALVGGCYFGWEHYIANPYREEGEAKIQKLWDADKAARIQRTTELTLMLSGKLMDAMDAQKRAEDKVNGSFDEITRLAGMVSRGGGIPLPADVVRVFDDSARAANSARADAGAEARADPVPAVPKAEVYDERELAEFGAAAGHAYADAYGLWSACRVREDAYLLTLQKGAQ